MERRKLHDEKPNELYASPNNFRVIKIEKNNKGDTCSAYVSQERLIQGFGGETQVKEANWMTQAQTGLITYLLHKQNLLE